MNKKGGTRSCQINSRNPNGLLITVRVPWRNFTDDVCEDSVYKES